MIRVLLKYGHFMQKVISYYPRLVIIEILPQEYERATYLAELVYNWASEFIKIKQ